MFKFAGRITLLERTDKNMSVGHFENRVMTHKSFCLILLSNHVCSLVFLQKSNQASKYFVELWNLQSINKLNLMLSA